MATIQNYTTFTRLGCRKKCRSTPRPRYLLPTMATSCYPALVRKSFFNSRGTASGIYNSLRPRSQFHDYAQKRLLSVVPGNFHYPHTGPSRFLSTHTSQKRIPPLPAPLYHCIPPPYPPTTATHKLLVNHVAPEQSASFPQQLSFSSSARLVLAWRPHQQ